MKAIRFHVSVPRYALGKALGKLSARMLVGPQACTRYQTVDPPALPGPDWVRVATRYGGICGSDLGAIGLHSSPYFEPLTSFPYTFGHENVGRIAEVGPDAGDFEPGQRVAVEPILPCAPRGIDPPCPFCAAGEVNRCENFTEGSLAPGTFIGYCRDTGGAWSNEFVAHRSQLHALDDTVSDEHGVLLDPIAVGLHAVLLDPPTKGETVLIQGAGTIGLTVLAALDALECQVNTIVVARHPHQAEATRRLGAGEVIGPAVGTDPFDEVARLTGAKVLKPMLGERVVVGGVDRAYECAGTDASLDASLRLTRAGGRVVLVGVPGLARGIDWSSMFLNELTVISSFAYHHAERHQDRTLSTFELALELIRTGRIDLAWMITHRFDLADHARAFKLHRARGATGLIKAAFEFHP